MSLLNSPHCPFPRVLSSPTSPPSRPSASSTSMAKSCRNSPSSSARWSGSGRMANPSPNTGYEPKLSNFYTYLDTVHTPIYFTHSHHDFQNQDDATVISTIDPEGLPHSGASRSSKTAASSDLQPSGNRWQIMCRVDQASRKLWQIRTEKLLQQRFLVRSRKGEEIETQTL